MLLLLYYLHRENLAQYFSISRFLSTLDYNLISLRQNEMYNFCLLAHEKKGKNPKLNFGQARLRMTRTQFILCSLQFCHLHQIENKNKKIRNPTKVTMVEHCRWVNCLLLCLSRLLQLALFHEILSECEMMQLIWFTMNKCMDCEFGAKGEFGSPQ